MMPDEVLDLLVAQDPRVRREDVLAFNKVYFAMLAASRVRKCLYVQHYLMVRGRGAGLRPISDFIDLSSLAAAADKLAATIGQSPVRARARFFAALARQAATPAALPVVRDFIRLQMLFRSGMNLKDVPTNLLLLGVITACDPDNFDAAVSINCGKGELSSDGGFVESGADANVAREGRFKESDRRPGEAKRRRRARDTDES